MKRNLLSIASLSLLISIFLFSCSSDSGTDPKEDEYITYAFNKIYSTSSFGNISTDTANVMTAFFLGLSPITEVHTKPNTAAAQQALDNLMIAKFDSLVNVVKHRFDFANYQDNPILVVGLKSSFDLIKESDTLKTDSYNLFLPEVKGTRWNNTINPSVYIQFGDDNTCTVQLNNVNHTATYTRLTALGIRIQISETEELTFGFFGDNANQGKIKINDIDFIFIKQ